MKKQKVLLVHNYYQIPGGEDTVVANEKRLLEENGHQVILYTRHNSELKELNIWQKLLLPLSTVFNLRTYREVKQIIRREHIDVVHVHNTLNLISPSVYYAAQAYRVPVVQTIHNFRMLCPGATFFRDGHICEECVSKGLGCAVRYGCYRGSRLQTLGVVVNTLFHRWTGIYSKIHYICLTEFNRDKLLQLNKPGKPPVVDPKKVHIKPNFTFTPPENRSEHRKHYLFVGRMEKIKGIDLLLEAFSRMPEVELHIAGSGKEQYEPLLQSRNVRNIKLLGFLNREQLKEEYAKARALVITAQTYEGFPMSIIEAYSNAVPVIAGNMGNSGDLVEEGRTGTHFQFDSVDSLVETIRRFEKTETESWRENAYQKYARNYCHPVNYDILLGIYAAESVKQKVLIVHNYYQLPGGEDTVVINEKQLLESYGHEVALYTRHNSELKKLNIMQKILLPFSTIFNLRTYREVRHLIREEKISVIHVHNTLNLISPSVYYAALAENVPVVQTIHNFRMLCPGAMFYRNGKICEDCVTKGLRCAVRHGCYRGSRLQTLGVVINTLFHRWTGVYRNIHYICLTEFNRDKLLQLNSGRYKPVVEPERIHIKPNFTFDAGPSNKDGEEYLVIGRVDQLKGIDLLLEAFRAMPDKKLAVAGSGENIEVYRAKASSNVTFLGQLSREQLRLQLDRAKAVIAASQLYESFGMTIAEAYAAHKPVIAGDIGNMGSLVEADVTGVKFRYDSPEALVEAIERFEQMDGAAMGECAYQKFCREYSPEENYDTLRDIYSQCKW